MSLKTKKKSRTSFGATAPPFIDYLKDILRRYPDGGQILKELIQNADDAQATEVVFVHDERSYGTVSLWTEELEKYQGPALYAYNNAAFTDEDWEGIQMAGRSVKRNDPNKVGRFGIGFNSVYHTTDVPSIFSSGHLGLMDPQEKIFGERNGGFLWSLDDTEHQEALMNMTDQFQPFRDIVSIVSTKEWSKIVLEDQHFDGTIFRFPLRNEASQISDNIYVSEKVVELFDSFIADAELSLLFLKNVTSVTLKHVKKDGTVSTRLQVKSSVPSDVVLESPDDSIIEGSTRFKLITNKSDIHQVSKWLITTCTMKEDNEEQLDSLAKKLSFFPQVDLAFPCGEKRDCSESRLSCFLPLPNNESNKTRLPVYINACFGLTDNRRHIKWQEEDQKHDEHAVWNELLMEKVFPQAYLMIIQDSIRLAQQSLLPVSSVYDLWPDVAQMQHKHKWHEIALDVLRQLFTQNRPVLSLAKDERMFIAPSEAVFPCNGPTSTNILAAIKRTLVSCGENLVTLPGSVVRGVIEAYEHFDTLTHVTPTFLRKILHKIDVNTISKEDKLCVLEYVLSDGKYSELIDLQLLPLNESFRRFTDKEEDTAFIDSEEFPRALLPCCNHLFIPDDLRPACRTHLKDIAGQNLFKIIKIDADQVAEYTKRFLPQDWMRTNAAVVTWDISNSKHPPLDWIQQFWKYLNNHFSELGGFCGLPLIPVNALCDGQPVLLAKLQQNTTLIQLKSKETTLPDQIAQLLSNVGGTVVKENKWLRHEDLETYLLPPSPVSVMKIMMNVDSQHLIKAVETASKSTREELKDFLSRLDSLSQRETGLLSQLPVFQNMKGRYVACQSNQAILINSGPTLSTELPMPDSVVQCATEADRRLLQLLKVNLLDTAEAAILLIDSIEKGACNKEETKKTMTWILQHGKILFSQNNILKHKCRELKFIEVNGELKKTSEFYDPRVQTFKNIFESDFFPPPPYTETPQILESLTDLGLLNKETDVSPKHLLQAATMIEKLNVNPQTQTRALKRGQALLKMLDANNLLTKFSNKEIHHLRQIKWVPSNQPSDDKEKKRCLFCPNEIKHSMYQDIVGHVMPLIEKLSDSVSSKLGLKDRPLPEKVRENLSYLEMKAPTMADPDINVDFKRKLHSTYKYMQDNMSEFAAVKNMDTCWLWSHTQFVSPRDLVLNYPCNLDLSSYIKKLPDEFLSYKNLFQKFGLRFLLSDDEVVDILYSIHKDIKARQQPFACPSEVKVSIEILNWLWREKKTVYNDIPLPVSMEGEKYTMKQRSKAVFCDVSKNGLKELKNSEEEIYVLHEEVPKATAEWLNVEFLSTYLLDPEQVGIEQWGQSEPITTRIKNILKEYDEESDIFKELIQNAEDAGAETCKFLVDFRVHKDAPESLIDPDMALCQGPCLWAFNDKQFTDLDWKNIIRVGAASKENSVEKIGKFGLGFNTVYHMTDVPSILSGNNLLILDPNVTHLKTHIKNKTNPGIKLDLSKQRLFKYFAGQFGPYERIFDCSFRKGLLEPYKGTLIKLPFRTEEEAKISEISTKAFHKHSIISVQEGFIKNSQTHLLFLKNINRLTLQSISNLASTPPKDVEIDTLLTVTKSTVNKIRIPDEAWVKLQHEAEKSLTKLNEKSKEVIDYCTVNVVQITSQQSDITPVQTWLIYNCFGVKQSLKIGVEENRQASFTLPIGGVAVPLQKDSISEKLTTSQSDLVGQVFCFLPLAINTGLPVNVNGTFAVTNNRKGLWETGVKHDWNLALLKDPVVKAYNAVLLTLKAMSKSKQLENYSFYTFWPDRAKVCETFKPLVDAFYSTIAEELLELFSDGEQWCSLNNSIFLHENVEQDKTINKLVVQVCKKYAIAPNLVVVLPLWLRNNFQQAGLDNVLQKRTWNWEKIYNEIVFPNLDTMDSVTRDTLVLHAIDLHIKEVDDLLSRYPCIPTVGGKLQYINKLVNPSGKAACLFDPEEGRLLGGTKNDFLCPKRIQHLLELGMANDYLPLEDLTEKADTISQTWETDRSKTYVQLKCLLELMKDHIQNNDSPHWKSLSMTDFLPAFSPGKETVELRRPADVFSDKSLLLVNMTKPVLDHNNLNIHSSDPVLQILGVQDSPNLTIVLEQLQEAYNQCSTTDITLLNKIAYECYKFLNQWISDNSNVTLISQTANSFPFIFIGNTFVNVDRVAEEEQFEAKPYLHMLPSTFTGFRKLWECVGVEKKFTINQFQSVLEMLHSKHGKDPLPSTDVLMCLTILNIGIFQAKEKPADFQNNFLIPNKYGVLQPANELFYNDTPWMPVASDITLCHDNISRAMACYFKIKTIRHHTLENSIVENISPFAFEFEQKEKLTVRIKNIISAYPSKKDILKELLQNADDAGATEINLVWDKRRHNTKKTFGDRWNPLQGPALCVFNNRIFSDADLVGIQQLGEGGKHSSPGKTGKYGVGFNSVYHLTDCPSILTGDKLLCISDPNQTYIESHAGKPNGIGYKLDDTFKNMYKDVYNSFLPDQFVLEEGTMFRLPLRTNAMANSSEVSQEAVTDRDMNELMSVLSEDPEGLILFLKNICKITVHEIKANSETLKTIFMVEKSIPQPSREKKEEFVKHQENALKSDKHVTEHNVIYEATVLTSNKIQSEWIIAEQFGSLKNIDVNEIARMHLPQAAIAARVRHKKQSYFPLEFLPIHSSSSDFIGAAFCSLPLPGKTGLPVHVNANFEVDAARRGLWKEDGQSLKTKWNEHLKKNVIAPLYADLLHYISCSFAEKKVTASGIDSCFQSSYLCFWPIVFEGVGQDWHEMIHEVYRSIKERALNVIPVIRSSSRTIAGRNVKEYSFDWFNVRETKLTKALYLIEPKAEDLNPILEDLGMKLVPFSTEMKIIWKNFKSAGVELKEVNPSTVRDFLREKPISDQVQSDEKLPLPISATLIKNETRCAKLLSFCLKDLSLQKPIKETSSILSGIQLLLTKDKILRVFNSNSPKLMSIYDSLFFGQEDRFADYQTHKEHFDVLLTFNVVKKLTLSLAAKDLKPLSQQLLQNCETDPSTGLHVPNEKMLKWLEQLWNYLTSEINSSTSIQNEQSLTISDVRQLFSDCSILPVICPRLNKSLLTTMTNMPSVIHFPKECDISDILFKLGFMKINSVFFSNLFLHRQLHGLLHRQLMDANDKSSILDQVYNINQSEFSKLSYEEMNELQNFLQSGLSKAKDNREYQRKLKSLPIFETIHGKRVRIDGPQTVYLLNNSTNSRELPDLILLTSNDNIILKDSLQNHILSQTLGIEVLTHLLYFVKFTLPCVHSLKTETQTVHCLKMLLPLQLDPSYSNYKDQIISSMKTVKLICNYKGSLEMASYYYDETIKLYHKMLPQERFVPDKFWTAICKEDTVIKTQLKQLLKDLGMKHIVSNDDIIHFAKQLQSEIKENGQLEDLKQKSSLLLKEALSKVRDVKKKQDCLLENIADIEFIFPVTIKKELRDYHQPFTTEGTAVKIRGSLIETELKHQELIWSSMPIIKLPIIQPEVMQKMKDVGAHEKPPSLCVIRNMVNICESPCETDALVTTRANVFRTSYAYLQANDFETQLLAGHPVVLVEKDKKLEKTDFVSLSLPESEDFRPYFFRISPKDVLLLEFFRKIGINEEPTVVQYCNVLQAIYAETCDKQQLQANQRKTVKRAVEQLFRSFEAEGNQSIGEDVKTLYLPATDGKLHPSSDLYYNDTVFETERIKEVLKNNFLLLEKLSECHLGSDIFKHQEFLQLLPQKFQPKKLSQFTEEKVEESDLKICELDTSCDFRGWFDKHLSSVAFRHGLMCLIREHSQGKITEEEAASLCEKTFGYIKIVCCERLETNIQLNNQLFHQTARETDVYVKKGQQGCIFYLKHYDDMPPRVITEICMALAKEINVLLGNNIGLTYLPVLGQLLMCDSLQDVQRTLAKNEIHDIGETRNSIFDLPAAGTDIPGEWHDALDMDILNNFEEGEYVGYKLTSYIYGIIIKELPTASGQYSRRYLIDTGEGEPVEVSCLDLYQFKREKNTKPEGRTYTSAKTSCMELEPLAGSVPHFGQTFTRRSTSARSSPASLDEAKREIDKCLEKIWSLPEEERIKAIHRLYLRWHPDKNPDCQDLATEAFKYLMNRLEKPGELTDRTANSSNPRGNSHFRDFYQQWNQEARYHRSRRENFFRGFSSYNFWSYHENVPKPNRKEAQRWLRQAHCDLQAANNDCEKSTEWCLFKVHQAVEKSLIAAQFKKCGQRSNSTSISAMAKEVSLYSIQLRVLPQLVSNLQMLGVDAKKTQYPNYHPFPHIPNGQFKPENEKQAMIKANELLSKVEEFIV